MTTQKRCILALALCAAGCTATAAREDAARVDSLFFLGVESYRQGRFQEALDRFEALDLDFQNHGRTTASLLFQGKALDRLSQPQRAKEAFQELLRDFPRSLYADDARYGLAVSLLHQGAARESLLELLGLLAAGGSKPLLERAEKLASDLADAALTAEDLKRLVGAVPDEKGKSFLVWKAARLEVNERRFESARELLDPFLRDHPRNPYAAQMEKLRARAESLGKGLIKFGVVLPLSGPLAEQGNALLAGMRYAVQAHNAGLEPKVELVVRDSEGNMIRAIQAAQSFCRDMDVAAIVGDLESHVTEAAAAVAQENGVPLIAPTAMEDGISGIGPFVFQLNGTLGDRARSLADYTVKGLGLSRFALFYPADGYGKVMRKAFTDAVTSLGGEILAEKWYSEGTEDFNPAMAALREAGIKRMLLDSLAAAGGAVTDLSGQWVDQKAASLADQRELPVTSIDAFLVLPSRSNIESIVSQVHYHNLETQLLGGASWDDPVFLNRHADVLDGLVFYSDYYVDPYNPNVLRFREGFRKMTGKNPDRFETIGYDAVSVLLDALGNRSVSREELRDRLAAVSGFIGVRGRIAFDNERVNAAFRLLQFKENRLVVVR